MTLSVEFGSVGANRWPAAGGSGDPDNRHDSDDEELWERWNDWAPKGLLEDELNECHCLFHEADLAENRLDRAVVTTAND